LTVTGGRTFQFIVLQWEPGTARIARTTLSSDSNSELKKIDRFHRITTGTGERILQFSDRLPEHGICSVHPAVLPPGNGAQTEIFRFPQLSGIDAKAKDEYQF
jgi:hypothetical protein